MKVDASVERRFWPKVQITPACWTWTAGVGGPMGHACMRVGGSMHGAHRVSYLIHKGEIPEGLVVRHRCDNPRCVNPDHLELGTQADNIRDMYERGRRVILWGDSHPMRKLSDSDVEEIQTAVKYRGWGRDLANKFGVTPGRIYQVRNGVDVPRNGANGKEQLAAMMKETVE